MAVLSRLSPLSVVTPALYLTVGYLSLIRRGPQPHSNRWATDTQQIVFPP